jgi:hypothetical protein
MVNYILRLLTYKVFEWMGRLFERDGAFARNTEEEKPTAPPFGFAQGWSTLSRRAPGWTTRHGGKNRKRDAWLRSKCLERNASTALSPEATTRHLGDRRSPWAEMMVAYADTLVYFRGLQVEPAPTAGGVAVGVPLGGRHPACGVSSRAPECCHPLYSATIGGARPAESGT